MLIKSFSENEWIYPDTDISHTNNIIHMYTAKNSTSGFQILTDHTLTQPASVSIKYDFCDCNIIVYQKGLLAFYVRLNINADAPNGEFPCTLHIIFNGEDIMINIFLKIYKAVIPDIKNANFHMINWLNLPEMRTQHKLEKDTDECKAMIIKYLENQLDMRNDYTTSPELIDETRKQLLELLDNYKLLND